MTFSTVPRSKHPVLSFQTQSHDIKTLRAEIEAASTQQQRFRSRQSRYSIEPTIEEEERPDPTVCTGALTNSAIRVKSTSAYAQRSTRQSLSHSVKSIRGTVKGELSTAGRFLRDTTFRRLHRLVPRSSTSTSTSSSSSSSQSHDGESYREELILGTTMFDSPDLMLGSTMSDSPETISGSTVFDYSEPAELSSDPLYQLEDNSRTSRQFEDFPITSSFFPASKAEVRRCSRSVSPGPKSGSLSYKSYSCDNCQQPICGGDLYDFCVMCSPSDRILCIVCARQRKCWRHQTDSMTMDKLSSARYSPAPPYSRPEDDESLRNTISHPAMHRVETSDDIVPESVDATNPGLRSPDGNTTNSQSENDLLGIINRLLHVQVSEKERDKHSYQSKEIALREQYAALREERAAMKEQELMVREREHLSRERDAVVIRSLQTLVAARELSKNPYPDPHSSPSDRNPVDSDRNYPANKMSPRVPERSGPFSLHISDPEPTMHFTPGEQDPHANEAASFVGDAKRNIRSRQGGKRKQNQMYSANHHSSGQRGNTLSEQKRSPPRQDRNSRDSEDHSEDEDVTPPKKQKHDLMETDLPHRIFACPYYKNNPTRYSPRNVSEKHYRGCSGHFLHDIPRLKQHLRRVHWRPEHHCPRCFEVFSEPGQLAQHFAQVEACSIQECPFPEKMDKVQRQQIHVKRPKVSPETLWYDIYRVLFPGTPLPESPYAEDDNVTPPVSAAPSSPLSEEVTQRMVKLFNERLDKHRNRPGYDWISSSTTRDLLNTAMSESLIELFGGLLLPVVSPSEPCASVPTSSLSSPVSPSLGYDPDPVARSKVRNDRSGPRKEDSSFSATLPSATYAPILKPPKRILNPALSDPNKARIPQSLQMNQNGQNGALHFSGTTGNVVDYGYQAPSAQTIPEHATEDMGFRMDETCYDFPVVTMPLDGGWDDQSNSYSRGDDLEAMEFHFRNPSRLAEDQSFAHLQTPKPMKPRRRLNTFVPVRLETLEDVLPGEIDRPGPLQSSKSIASLVDSGYGSGNSEHSIPRAHYCEKEPEVSLDGNTLGHTTFNEELELLQNIDDNPNPWRTENSWAR